MEYDKNIDLVFDDIESKKLNDDELIIFQEILFYLFIIPNNDATYTDVFVDKDYTLTDLRRELINTLKGIKYLETFSFGDNIKKIEEILNENNIHPLYLYFNKTGRLSGGSASYYEAIEIFSDRVIKRFGTDLATRRYEQIKKIDERSKQTLYLLSESAVENEIDDYWYLYDFEDEFDFLSNDATQQLSIKSMEGISKLAQKMGLARRIDEGAIYHFPLLFDSQVSENDSFQESLLTLLEENKTVELRSDVFAITVESRLDNYIKYQINQIDINMNITRFAREYTLEVSKVKNLMESDPSRFANYGGLKQHPKIPHDKVFAIKPQMYYWRKYKGKSFGALFSAFFFIIGNLVNRII